LEARKKKRYKKAACWLLVDLAVAATVFALLLYRPSSYEPLGLGPTGQTRQVSSYLTHYLLPKFYNGAQSGEPFELVVIEKGINETIARSIWPMESEGVWFSTPAVLFVPDSIVFMGTANIRGAEFIVTIMLEPRIDEQGLLNLDVRKVKVGAMNITPLAKLIAKQMYARRVESLAIEEYARTKIVAALLNAEPFDPVFQIEDKKVRLQKVTVTQGRLILRMVPAS
jgi:hypothetical protein